MSAPPSKLKQRVVTSPFRSDILKGQVAIITGGGERREEKKKDEMRGRGGSQRTKGRVAGQWMRRV